MKFPLIKLNNGRTIPQIGLGTWKGNKGEVKQSVIEAIKLGYRHVDCAMSYDNEYEVGEALRECIPSLVKREDLFVTSKLWITDYEDVENGLMVTLHKLGLDYVDLYLIHWPVYKKPKTTRDPKDFDHWFPGLDIEADTLPYEKGWIVKLWQDLEACVEKGLIKCIGVSNFTVSKLEKVLEIAKIPPAVNQIEIHPALSNEEVVNWCKSKGIQVTAYSPLGSMDRPAKFVKDSNPIPLKDPVVLEIAKKHNKSPAQVILRWDIQRSIIVIPKSVHKERMEENFNIFDFELSEEEMNNINKLNCNNRIFLGSHFFDNDSDRENLWK